MNRLLLGAFLLAPGGGLHAPVFESNAHKLRISTVAKGLSGPWTRFARNDDGSVVIDQPWRDGMASPRFYWVPSIGLPISVSTRAIASRRGRAS